MRLIDRQGNFVNENTYSVGNMGYMDLFLDKWMILGDQDGIVAIINGETGEACFDYPIEHYHLSFRRNGADETIWLCSGGLWGLMDLSAENAGHWIIEPQFADVKSDTIRGWRVNLTDDTGAYIDSNGIVTGPAPLISRVLCL